MIRSAPKLVALAQQLHLLNMSLSRYVWRGMRGNCGLFESLLCSADSVEISLLHQRPKILALCSVQSWDSIMKISKRVYWQSPQPFSALAALYDSKTAIL